MGQSHNATLWAWTSADGDGVTVYLGEVLPVAQGSQMLWG